MKFRIRDILDGKTIFTADRGRDILVYWIENRPLVCEWEIQYESPYGWYRVPSHIIRKWWEKSESESN